MSNSMCNEILKMFIDNCHCGSEICRATCDDKIYNKGDLHGGKTTMLYLNLSGH